MLVSLLWGSSNLGFYSIIYALIYKMNLIIVLCHRVFVRITKGSLVDLGTLYTLLTFIKILVLFPLFSKVQISTFCSNSKAVSRDSVSWNTVSLSVACSVTVFYETVAGTNQMSILDSERERTQWFLGYLLLMVRILVFHLGQFWTM